MNKGLFKFMDYNLNTMSSQEVFDASAKHLLTQGKRSRNENGEFLNLCLYRHENLKCAAGIFIPDDKYDPQMEKQSWTLLSNNYPFLRSEHTNLIGKLQIIHDQSSPEMWFFKLNQLAKSFGLKPYEIEKSQTNI